MVCATQNPLEFEGTYPLPEAQLDRFMMKILITYPSFNEEREIVRKHHEGFSALTLEKTGIQKISDITFRATQESLAVVTVKEPLMDYAVEIVSATRKSTHALMGASPRGSIHLLTCARAYAALQGRDYVIPDDIKSMALSVLRHRIIIKPEADMEGVTGDDVIRGILNNVNVPR
jgi:MoxR-like ATPase